MTGSAGFCVIMAGGRGTRFWPLSRLKHPKQLLPLGPSSSLLKDTFDRVEPLVGRDHILVITNVEQVDGVAKALPELPRDRIIAEPIGRNTSACAVLGMRLADILAPGSPVALLPADHLISDPVVFRRQLEEAFALARQDGGVLTFGIPATRPETGYGYLECKAATAADSLEGLCFIEKPGIEQAEAYCSSGRHYWNSGIFVWNSRGFRAAVTEHLPDLDNLLNEAGATYGMPEFQANLARAYDQCPSISIDVGIMEKLTSFKVIPAEFGWSDLGSWDAWGATAPELGSGNRGVADLVARDSTGNVVHAVDGTVALLGVENLIVVQTGDALLIADRNHVQAIRELTVDLEKRKQQDLL